MSHTPRGARSAETKKPRRLVPGGALGNIVELHMRNNDMAHGSAAQVEVKDIPFMPDTPEAGFIPDPRLYGEPMNVDAVICACSRMQALLLLLHVGGRDAKNGFSVSHDTIANALWLLDGQVEQLRALAEASAGIRSERAA